MFGTGPLHFPPTPGIDPFQAFFEKGHPGFLPQCANTGPGHSLCRHTKDFQL
jgi:hypothetical protein